MPSFLVLRSAKHRLENIYRYTKNTWGKKQAEKYIEGMFHAFDDIANKQVVWRPIPAEFGVSGYFSIYEKHTIYWKELSSGEIGIVTVLHERMHQIDRFHDDTKNKNQYSVESD